MRQESSRVVSFSSYNEGKCYLWQQDFDLRTLASRQPIAKPSNAFPVASARKKTRVVLKNQQISFSHLRGI